MLEKWQGIMNLTARTIGVPSALIVQIDEPQIEIVASNVSEDNPYNKGGRYDLDTGLYCETVMAERKPLLIPDAREDPLWTNSPELEQGMVCYLGLPLLWPDGELFGTICVLDRRENPDVLRYQDLVWEFGQIIQSDLKILVLTAEREQTNEALNASREYLRRVIDASPIGVIHWKMNGAIVEANDYFLEMIGYDREDLRAGRIFWTRLTPSEFHERDLQVIAELRASGQNTPYEKIYIRKDGSRVPILLSSVLVNHKDWDGVAFIIDITEQKRSEALKQAKEIAEASNRAKDQFLAMLSHELRTPLTPVLAAVTALEAQGDPELQGDMKLIRRNVEIEVALIDDLLDVTRINYGKLQLQLETVDAHECLLSILKMRQREITAKHLEIVLELQASEFFVEGDRTRLRQVFWNLLQNAIKFTPQGGKITLRTTSAAGHLKIEIIDTGAGIDPEVLPRVFNAFEQGEKTKNRRFGGLGLGLTIAKAMVDLHQGTLTAFSEGRNKGATFTVELNAIAVRPELPPSPLVVPAPREEHSLRILLVDDHRDTLQIMSRLLRKWGHQVTPADCLQVALRLASKEKFDLLISDLGLPDGSGLDIMRQVKRLYGLHGIAISGYGADDDLRESRAAGFEQHLIKPVSFEALHSAVESFSTAGAV